VLGTGRWRESGGGVAKGGLRQRPGPAESGPWEAELGGDQRRWGWRHRPTVLGLVAEEAVQGTGTGRAAAGRKAART
jgi:hypothetical protein